MGVKTSSELFDRDVKAGAIYAGERKVKDTNTDSNLAFRFPVPVHGESNVSMDIDGEIVKLKLKEGVYTVPEDWGADKKLIYKKVLIGAGFEDVSYMYNSDIKKPEPEPEKQYTYFAGHPDNKDNEKINGKMSFTLNKIKRNLEIIDGVITTTDKEEYQKLLEKGYYEAKPAEEIKEGE